MRKMTIINELKIENQWICSSEKDQSHENDHEDRENPGRLNYLMLKEWVVQVNIKALGKRDISFLPLDGICHLQCLSCF